MASNELGYALRHGRRTLHVQQVGDTRNRAVLNRRKPGVEQVVAVHEQPLGLRAQDRKHRLGDGCCLLRPAQFEIEVAAGDLDLTRAAAAADELSRIAALFESKALFASVALAHGRLGLAGGDAAGARRELEVAVHRWSDVGAPYETALARMGLAHAYRAEGNEERAILELQAARLGFVRVGAVDQAHVPTLLIACSTRVSSVP